MNYPVILKPELIDAIQEIEYYYYSIKPKEPIFSMKKPDNSKLEESLATTALSSIFRIILIICAFILVFGSIPSLVSGRGNMNEAFGFLLLGVIVSSVILYSLKTLSNEKVKTFKCDLENYNIMLNEFKEKLDTYQNEVEEYNKLMKNVVELSKDELKKFGLRKFFKERTTIPKYFENNYKKGKTESHFFEFLSGLFPGKIYKNYAITPDFEQIDSNNYYLPDICYYNKSSGMCIDIEIDEQFESNKGNLIHDKYNVHDIKRNDFFLRNGWIILRFAESQIKNDMIGCAALIYQLIKKYEPDLETFDEAILNYLQTKPIVKNMERW